MYHVYNLTFFYHVVDQSVHQALQVSSGLKVWRGTGAGHLLLSEGVGLGVQNRRFGGIVVHDFQALDEDVQTPRRGKPTNIKIQFLQKLLAVKKCPKMS